MEHKIYLKRCLDCQGVFNAENPRERKCPHCKELTRRKNKYKAQQQNKKPSNDKTAPSLSIKECEEIVRKYNKEHGTYHSYGQYDLLVRMGIIENKNWR